MESLIYWQTWLFYLIAALAGCWCWQQMFFWLPRRSLGRYIAYAPGWALLLTPGPATGDDPGLSPAFIGLLFGVLNEDVETMAEFSTWLALGLLAALVLAVIYYLVFAQSEKSGSKASSAPSGTARGAVKHHH